MSLKRTVN
jgi:hypothetical protein